MTINELLLMIGIVVALALAFVIRVALKIRNQANANVRSIDEWIHDVESNKK